MSLRSLAPKSTHSPIHNLNKTMDWKTIIHYISGNQPSPPRRVERSQDEWRSILSDEQFRITRQHGTERAFSGAFCSSHEPGKYSCVCCQTPLFDSTLKFESNSGWPSFTEPLQENAIRYTKDSSYGMIRVEVSCNVCDAHLGHVFPDGPEPTGLRFCINSVSLERSEESDDIKA